MFGNAVARNVYPCVDWTFGCFSKVYCDTPNINPIGYDDKTIFAMLKLLVAPRIEGDEIYHFGTISRYHSSIIRTLTSPPPDLKYVSEVCGLTSRFYDFPIMNICVVNPDDYAELTALSRKVDFPIVEQFLSQHNTPALINSYDVARGYKNIVIYISRTRQAVKTWHAIASVIPALLPEYFENKPLDDLERAMLSALGGNDVHVFTDAVARLISEKNYEEEYLRDKLRSFGTSKFTRKINSLQNNIDYNESTIEQYIDEICNMQNKIEEYRCTIIGLREKINNSNCDTELLDYLSDNKSAKLVDVNGSLLTINIYTYLQNYDIDAAEKIINNENSSLYSNRPDIVSFKDANLLYKTVFLDERAKIKTTARIQFGETNGGTIILCDDCTPFSTSYLRNPHTYHHQCFGDNKRLIKEAIVNCDYVGAIAQLISSIGNLNFYDGFVTNEFGSDIYNTDLVCIEFPDGVCLNAYDAIARIKNEQTDNIN